MLLHHLLLHLLQLENLVVIGAQLRLVSTFRVLLLCPFNSELLTLLLVDHAICVQFGKSRTSTGTLISIRWLCSLHVDLWNEVWNVVSLYLVEIFLLFTLELTISLLEAKFVNLLWDLFVFIAW